MPQHYKCDRTTEVIAYVRLLVDPPVTVMGRRHEQTLRVVSNPVYPYPPFGKIELTCPDSWTQDVDCHSGGHAHHILMHGLKIKVPSIWSKFFWRLKLEGRAEFIWGPHSPLRWWPDLPEFVAPPDAYYGYNHPSDPAEDVAPGHKPPPKSA